LVHGVPCQQEGEQVPDAVVIRHVVQPGDLQAPLHLGIGVGHEIGKKVPAGGEVGALPRVAVAVHRPRTGSRDDSLLDVRAADDGGHRRIGLDGILRDAERRLLQQLGNHGGQHFDVAEFFRADPEQHVPVLSRDVRIPRLKRVLQGHGDLPVLTAQNLLEFAGVDCVGLIRRGVVLELLPVKENHCYFLHSAVRAPTAKSVEAQIGFPGCRN
jgi:hypothetical protein